MQRILRIPNITIKHNWRKISNRAGLYPIHISIYLPGEPVRYYLIKVPQKVSTEEWLGVTNKWVSNTHLFYFEINCKISETLYKLNELTKRYYNSNKPVTFYAIENELMLRGEGNIFNDYFREYIRRPPATVSLDRVNMGEIFCLPPAPE